MKPKSTLRHILSIASSAMLAISYSQAATLYWDSNGTGTAGAGATPTGTWGTSVFWSTDSTGANVGAPVLTAATTNVDDLFYVAGPGAASGNNAYVATVDTAQVANSLTFQASGATTLSGGTSITLGNGTPGAGGITMNQFAYGAVAQGAATISTALSLANSQSWTNNSANALTFGQVTLGSTLTFAGSGNFTATAASFGNAGTGGIIMNGTGVLNTRVATSTNYTGSTTINSGVVLLNAATKSTGNFNLNGGMVTDYFQQTGVFSSGLGAGANQIQITGNSGFGAGNGTSVWRIGTAGSVLIWGASGEGAATGFFNPTTLKFQTAADNNGPTIYGIANFDNGLNLNGVARTIDVLTASAPIPTTSGASIAGVISNGSLVKTGGGNLTLANAGNSWAGTTTISGGFLTVAATGALGSASNTLEFNGGTLRATGTVTSPTTRAVTMTGTGIIDTNAQAISIAGNIGGLGGLTKNSTGTLTLSGTNGYGGVTTVNAGTLAIAKTAALASNTAANLNVKSGASLQLNVGGSGEFAASDLNTLLGNISVANSAVEGLQRGAILALDTTNAGGSFTQGNAIINSTGASGGVISLTKLGTGTLVLDKANTYTGPTTISAGTLQLDAGGVIATAIGNNSAFAVNSAGSVTQGTNFGLISGTGTLTKTLGGTLALNLANTFSGTTTVSAGTLALTNALALQNSALVTTSGTSTIGAFSAVTIGGLSGATGDLGSANVLNGYTGNVSALTLNPQTGVSVTYGGIISNGSGAMSLTKTGAGTQILTGANNYTGATIVNAGTLSIGVGGSLSSSSALQINGGTYSYGNTAAGQTLNGLAVSGNSTVSNTAAGQTLTLGAITRTASIFGTVNFATLTGSITTTTGNTNGIIGPWATTGATTSLRYAVGSPDGSTPTNITPFTTGTTATANTLGNVTDATVNYEYSAAVAAMPASTALTGNTLRYSGAATGTAINATSTLTLNGLMQAGTGLLTISGGPTTGGILIGSTGELVIAANAQATTISATIGGTGRLVYSGAGSVLSLSSLTNAYTGGTVVNSGTVTLTGTANTNVDSVLGNASGGITLNGGQLRLAGVNVSAARIVTVNGTGSSIFTNKNNNFATTGKLTGDGTLSTLDGGGSGTLSTYSFNSTANDYTGRLNGTNTIINVNSLGNSTNSIVLDGATFNYGTGATGATSLANRVIELSGTTGGATINNNNTTAANTLTIGGGLLITGVGNKTLTLGGANTGANTFGGNISDGPGSVISLTANGALGHWIVPGNSTYTGQTTVAGTASLTLSGDNSAMTGNVVLSTATTTNPPRLNVNSATALGTGTLNFGGGLATDTVRLDNTSVGAVNVSTANAITMNRNFTFVGTQNLSLGTGTATIGGITAPGTRSITVTANTLTLGGAIAETVGLLGINKAGAGTLVLSGTGSTYTGATVVTAGTLAGIGANAFGSTSGISVAAASSATLSLRGDSSTNFVKTSDSSLYPFTTTANGATINVDQATIAGTGAKTMTIGSLGINAAITNGTTFTGANNTSLSIGAVTTGASVSGTETLTNDISGGGSLTLASIAVNRTTAPTLAFAGNGNTTVTGAIGQVATTALTKSGNGTLLLNGTTTYTGTTTVNAGTLTLGVDDCISNSSNVLIGTATLNLSTNVNDTAGTLDPTTTGATINLGSGATLAFADSSAVVWTGGSLAITGTFVSGSSLRFGTTSGGLTLTQLGQITGVGAVTLNGSGFLISSGGSTYADWLALNGPATGFVTDSDNDGLSNGVENVLGSNPNTYNAGLTEVSATATSVVFKHTLNPSVASDVSYSYQWSTDMAEWKSTGQTNTGGTTATIAASAPVLGVVTVTVTITGGPSAKLFGRLVAVK